MAEALALARSFVLPVGFENAFRNGRKPRRRNLSRSGDLSRKCWFLQSSLCSGRSLQMFAIMQRATAVDGLASRPGRTVGAAAVSEPSSQGMSSLAVDVAQFELFTERAIKVVILAHEEAKRRGQCFVGAEHVMFGPIVAGTGIAAKVMVGVEKKIGVLELFLEVAQRLGIHRDNYIGTTHLLIRLLREADIAVARVVENLGAGPRDIRKQGKQPTIDDPTQILGRTTPTDINCARPAALPIPIGQERSLVLPEAIKRIKGCCRVLAFSIIFTLLGMGPNNLSIRKAAALPPIATSMQENNVRHQKTAREEVKSKDVAKLAKELEQFEQMSQWRTLLPLALNVQDNETLAGDGNVAKDEQHKAISQEMREELKRAESLRQTVEEWVRSRHKADGEERVQLVMSPDEEIVKGSPPIDVRWTFGDKQVLIPDPVRIQQLIGWRKWMDESKANLKKYLLENPEAGREYVAKRQEETLVARDRILAQTWYDKQNKRWEMAPVGALHAVTKYLADKARIRHDRGLMYLKLKGDDREYYVNIPACDEVFRKVGGFDMLYLKMITSGVPTRVELMWIPFSEWDIEHLFQLPFKMAWWLLQDLWNSRIVRTVWPWYFNALSGVFEEVMIRFGFPLVHRTVPQKVRVLVGFDLAEGAEAAEPTEIITWQQEAQKHVDARYAEGSGSPAWWISLPVRCYLFGVPLLFVLRLMLQLILAPLKPKPIEMNLVQWKEKKQAELEREIKPQTKKQTMDPIKTVFDNMKRVKRPQVSLKDFAGIDAIMEEINEVVSFLKNPKVYKEMGARPPRGVLIEGESGTGKTTLALAIAAEARVPMIELQGAELEGGAWVGQGASNVRELFKTAREMAPLIIFMDDFDHFAGVRGATSDTRKQDHESLINQLLVELDGFETQEGVVLIATTSRAYAIDEALRRPGRMDRTISLPTPNRREREQILKKVAAETMDPRVLNFVDWNDVAEKTAGLTPAQLKYVPEGLQSIAVSYKKVDDEEIFNIYKWLVRLNSFTPQWIKGSKWMMRWNQNLIDWLDLRVTREDMRDAIENMDVYGETKTGLELYDPDYNWTREFKYPHAVWAVGRGLLALLIPNFVTVDKIWLDSTSYEGIAFTKLTKRLEGGYKEMGIMTRSLCEKELVLCFGPFVASRILIPPAENNNLSMFELEKAKEIAVQMVMEYGWAPDDSPMIYRTGHSEITLSMGESHEFQLDAKIEKLYYNACEKAVQILQRNRPAMDAMLEYLLENEIMDKEDMTKLLEDTDAVFEEEPFNLVPYTHTEMLGISTNGTGRKGTPVTA